MNFFFIIVIIFCAMLDSIAMDNSANQLIEIIDLCNNHAVENSYQKSSEEYALLSQGKDTVLPIKMMGEKIDEKILQRALNIFPETVKQQIEDAPNPSIMQIATAPYYLVHIPACLLIRTHFYRENIERDPLTAEFFKQISSRFAGSYYIDKCTQTIKNNIHAQESTVTAISAFYNKAEIITFIDRFLLIRNHCDASIEIQK